MYNVKMIARTTCALIIAVAGHTLQAQQQDDCKKLIVAYIDNMASIQAPQSGDAYHIHFTTEALSADPRKTQSSTVEAHVYLDHANMTYQTGQMVMMRDAQDAFMIIHPQKKIIWAKGGLNPKEGVERISLGNVQKKLVEDASVSYCRTEVRNGQSIKVIGLVPEKKTAERMNVKSCTFYYSATLQKMQQVVIEFTTPSPIQKQTITYHTIDFDYKNFKPNASYRQVFASEGRLHQKYNGYLLVDNKNQK